MHHIHTGLPVIGPMLAFGRDPVQLAAQELVRSPVASFRLGTRQSYLISGADYAYEALVGQGAKFFKDTLSKKAGSNFVGNGLVLSDGNVHRQQRRRMTPAFYHSRINAYVEIAHRHTLQRIARWQNYQVINVGEEMSELALDILSEALFGLDAASDSGIHTLITEFFAAASAEVHSPILTLLPNWLPIPHKRRLIRSQKALHLKTAEIINRRRSIGIDQGDLLSTLILATEDGGMTDVQLHDEVSTLYLTGHETTANLLTWALHLLGKHPEVMLRLREEALTTPDTVPTLESLRVLPYVDQVIKESMRMYPPIWLMGREATEDVTIGDLPLKKGDYLYIIPYMIHNNPAYHADPHTFRPERWANGAEKALPKCSYIPFGAGGRMCIGYEFALMEARLILTEFARRVDLDTLVKTDPPLDGGPSLRPGAPVKAVVRLC